MSQYLNPPQPQIPQPGAPLVQPRRHGLAIPALVFGILSFILFIFGIAGLIVGVLALSGISKSGGTLTGRGLALAGILCSAIGLLIFMIGVFAVGSGARADTGKPVTPDVDLDLAERNIGMSAQGVAYSNSERGHEYASFFSKAFKESVRGATNILDDDDDFVTHCQLHEDSVAFIVNVPKLRKFNDESKVSFCEAAWEIALGTLMRQGVEKKMEVAVGVRGNILYENMYFGTYTPGNMSSKPTRTAKDEEALEAFFKGAPEPEPTNENEEQ